MFLTKKKEKEKRNRKIVNPWGLSNRKETL
jgi:hypothetical protein